MVRKKFSKLLHEECIVVGQPTVFLPLFGEQLGMFFGFFRQFYFAEGGMSSQAYDFHYYTAHETHTHFCFCRTLRVAKQDIESRCT